MTTMKAKVMGMRAAMVPAVMAMVMAGTAMDARAQSSIEGTWIVQVQLRACDTQALLGAPFNSLVTFEPDGTIIEAAEVPAFAVGQRLAAQGQWTALGGSRFAQRMAALIAFDTAPNPPATPGFKRGGQVVTHVVQLIDADTMASSGTNGFYDLAGQLYRSGCSTATGRRFR